MRAFLAAILVLAATPASAQTPATVREVTEAWPSGSAYCADGLPDRVTLTPGADPARAMGVAWRTDARQTEARLQLGLAIDSPLAGRDVRDLKGRSNPLTTENGRAVHHRVALSDLIPATDYVYRVRGAAGWSEWHAFRTPADGFEPFTAIWLGDLQNDILEVGARVVRKALLSTTDPALVLHAGDLVQQRDGGVHDDEWGEWHATGGALFAAIPQLPAAGNHEYLEGSEGEDRWRLGPHWPLAFVLPDNGAEGADGTTYTVEYQDVRFIVLDGTSARELGTLDAQARWLDDVLSRNTAHWTVVLMHQPLFPCARPNPPGDLNRVWRPILEAHKVDLVLQGHDHCYGRTTDPEGGRAATGARQTPVYLVSVAGGKMYPLNDRAADQTDRLAEDTQLYQTLRFEAERLVYEARTATGRLYDAFRIETGTEGRRLVHEDENTLVPERMCRSDQGPDREGCTADR